MWGSAKCGKWYVEGPGYGMARKSAPLQWDNKGKTSSVVQSDFEYRGKNFTMHIVLAGDSIFDNGYYVSDGKPVIQHLRDALPMGSQATLLAVDGEVISEITAQLKHLPDDASHLVISAGGNDALSYLELLEEPARSFDEVLAHFHGIRQAFAGHYRVMLDEAISTGHEVAVCTIYDSVPELAPGAHAALAMFNEVIMREAFRAGIPLIDLRLVCTEEGDYSDLSPIEPSEQGGLKIIQPIMGFCFGGERSASRVYR